MSFILDALKKSETERQRQSGPALFEVKTASPRSRLPAWAIAVGALLAMNLAIVAWALLRSPHEADSAPEPAAKAVAAPAASGAASEPASGPAPGAPAATRSAAVQPLPGETLASRAPPLLLESAGEALDAGPLADDSEQAGAASVRAETARASTMKPALETGGIIAPDAAGGASSAAGLPTRDDVLARGVQLPELRLDLHVYAAQSGGRFVLLNMRRLREGESLPDGVRVESITMEGAVLSYRGTRFLLQRE
jgi:general secretion pathway protein B